MRQLLIMLQLLAAVGFAGCASTLNIAYDPSTGARSPLTVVEPRHLDVGEFVDKRPETDRIGDKRNMYGGKVGKIHTARPVPTIVRDAIVTELKRSGHLLDAPSNLLLTGEVTAFWFDYHLHFATVDFIGRVSVVLNATDKRTGTALLTRTVSAEYTEQSWGGGEGTWERVMNTALARLVRAMSTDDELLRLLKTP
jgi:hypothetical protein